MKPETLKSVMDRLRSEVKKLEEEAAFEALVANKISPAVEEPPSTSDLDKLMKSMLGLGPSGSSTPTQNGVRRSTGRQGSSPSDTRMSYSSPSPGRNG